MNRIKEFCEKAGMTQVDLAKRLNVQPYTVWRWCSDKRTPHWADISSMCEILGCKPDELMGGTNPTKPQERVRKISGLVRRQMRKTAQILSESKSL